MTVVDAGPAPGTTADGAGPAVEGDPESGLTAADLEVIAAAQAQIFKVCSEAAARTLAAGRPEAEQAVAEAETALTEAREALEGPQAIVDRLNAELAECQRRGGEIQLAKEDASLTVRLEARSLKVAIEEETAALGERVRTANRVTDPLTVAVSVAERKVKAARGFLTLLDSAIRTPFFTDLGKATVAHRRWMLACGAWYGSASPQARALVMGHLRATKLGHELQVDAIRAFTAGDPAALAAGGNVRHFPDGTTITVPPDGAPVVTTGQATPEGLSTAAPVNTVPGPSAADVLTGARNAVGWPTQAPASVTKAAGNQTVVPETITRFMDWASR